MVLDCTVAINFGIPVLEIGIEHLFDAQKSVDCEKL